MGRPVRDLFTLADSGVIRVRELLELVNVQVANEQGRLMSVFDRACHVLGRDEGKDLRQFWGSIRVICDSSISTSPDDAAVALLLKATWKVRATLVKVAV